MPASHDSQLSSPFLEYFPIAQGSQYENAFLAEPGLHDLYSPMFIHDVLPLVLFVPSSDGHGEHFTPPYESKYVSTSHVSQYDFCESF